MLLIVYIVLGVLYESFMHPLTILSTLPSAGLGALLALRLTETEFSLIALLGLFLLIGIVMKNAILMIDFALAAERRTGLHASGRDLRGGLLRLRPILMTNLAALLGALPLAAHGRRCRNAPAARPCDCRRLGGEPAADALYGAGGVSLSRSAAPVGARRREVVPAH